MKFLFKTLFILIITFLILKVVLYIFDTGHTITYNVGNFNVEENFKADGDNYNFLIKGEKNIFNLEINQNYFKASKVITKIYNKKIDGYECILPIFKGHKILTDVMCLKNNTITYVHDLNNEKIKEFANSIKGYDPNIYKDKGEKTDVSTTLSVYENNVLENNYIAIENYRGLELINSKISSINIFENDIYKKPISIFLDKYYVVADYSEEYSFKKFYVINIINGKKTEIRSYDDISFDSYIMGCVDDDIYLFDKDAQIQYKISIKNESVEKYADKDNLKYYNGKWESLSLMDAINGKYFNNYYTNKIKGYDKVDKVGDTYYLYKKNKNKYEVYKSNVNNAKIKTYLFNTTNPESVIYTKNAIYYRNGTTYYYNYNNGNRKLLKDTELEFNNDITLGVYEK